MSAVDTAVKAAAASASDPMVIAVVDRPGNILAIYHKAGAPTTGIGNFGTVVSADELAVGLARTAAFFTNNQAPLSSRTVRFISGIHFPPGVSNTPSAALYGIENTNRGCGFNVTFAPGKAVPPARSIDNTTTGLGIITGKADNLDSDPTAVNPGGVPLFAGGEAVGGIGVVAARSDVAEYAAFTAAGGPPLLLTVPPPGAVLIDGITLPFVAQITQPAGTSTGTADGAYVLGPMASPGPVPEGDLVVAHDGPIGGLTAAEVQKIVDQAVATANQTRAVIRLPLGQRARMVIAVVDLDGSLLALNRMPDATVFSIDVAVAKARNMIYFNSGAVSPRISRSACRNCRDQPDHQFWRPALVPLGNRCLATRAVLPSLCQRHRPSLHPGITASERESERHRLLPGQRGTLSQWPAHRRTRSEWRWSGTG